MPLCEDAAIDISRSDQGVSIKLVGSWTYKTGPKIIQKFNSSVNSFQNIILDFENLDQFDYFMAVSVNSIIKNSGKNIQLINVKTKFADMFKFVNDKNINYQNLTPLPEMNFFAKIGKIIVDVFGNLLNLATFIGEFFIKSFRLFAKPSRLRFKEISNHCMDAGIRAIFIVCLTSFLIGVVLAYIGSDMLSRFGASVFVIDIMGMLTLREIGPLIAAIVMAGRSASSFTAQIGVMKITEEIDAMKTMGFEPFYFLTMPRVIAMIIITPLLIFLADTASIIAQMIVCQTYLDIDFASYLDRFKQNINIRHFMVGMIKAPFFGAAIAIIGCMRGFEVSKNTESVGSLTTISVVNAIFWVIALDALFAIIFSELKI